MAQLSGLSAQFGGYNGGPAIYIEGSRAGVENIDVYNNHVYGNTSEGIVVADEIPDLDLADNVNKDGKDDNGTIFGVRNVRIYNNVVHDNGLQGTNSGAGIMVTSNVNDVEIYNNTVARNVQSLVIDGDDYTNGYKTYDVVVRNNIFADATFRNGFIQYANDIVLNKNLFTNGFNQLYEGGNELNNFVETNNTQVASIDFVNAQNVVLKDKDFRLSSTSAAIDIGSSLIPDYASIDKDGILRNKDGDGDGALEPDVGAYEYVPPM